MKLSLMVLLSLLSLLSLTPSVARADDVQTIKIDATHVMVCGAKRPLDSSVGASGMVRVCEVVRVPAKIRGSK